MKFISCHHMISLIKWSPNYKESTNIKLKVIKTIANEEENVMDFIESKFGAKQRKRMFMKRTNQFMVAMLCYLMIVSFPIAA